MGNIEKKVKLDLYQFPRVIDAWKAYPGRMTGDAFLRYLGFESASFTAAVNEACWHMTEEDYIWFVLNWS